MNAVTESIFTIVRDDRAEGPKTIVRASLSIGRLQGSDIWLNYPTVAEIHVIIAEVDGCFFFTNFSASSATTLNGRVIALAERVALAEGDEVQIGPYGLAIEETYEILRIRVTRQFVPQVGKSEARSKAEVSQEQLQLETRIACPPVPDDVVAQLMAARRQEKASGRSALHPRTPPYLGKSRYNWTPTQDLIRSWPFAIFIWAFALVGTLSAAAAMKYKGAFAPREVSSPHTRTNFTLPAAIAKQPNGDSCFTCHVLGVNARSEENMNANCAACHQTEAFAATITPAHREAGITCTTCHAEHRGKDFSPMKAALESCTKCHTDEHKLSDNRKSVRTAHWGTFGYPVVNGRWVWEGWDKEELEAKSEIAAQLKANRLTSDCKNPPDCLQPWRRTMFHLLHADRVGVIRGIDGIEDVDTGNQALSCSSCHKVASGANLDRTSPRDTCAQCHNAKVFDMESGPHAAEKPSCTSCHVQHIRDTRWTLALRIVEANRPAPSGVAK
jgi:FHA domain-containing protein